MGGGKFRRTAAGTLGLATAALVGWAVSAAGQPPLVIDDPNVEPAQFTRPAGAPTGAGTAPPKPVADPPSPTVKIQVRVPADSPPDDDVKYLITVQNVSQADAHQVTVRDPLPEGATPVKAEPPWDKASDAKQLVWFLGTLQPGESKTIELMLKPKPGAAEVRNLAYVRFEHGEAVTTKINRPAVKLTKTAPKQAVKDEAYPVRVVVENTGRVPAEAVRVVENVDRSSEVEAVTTGAKRTNLAENQWTWEFPRLMPGERKVIEYRVTPRQAKESLSTTVVAAEKKVQETAETRTQVLMPGLTLTLAGPTGVVEAGEHASYEIVVANTGTMPSTNVKVVGTFPADCKPTRKTDGGQVFRDQIVWTIAKLEPGEARSFHFALKAAGATGQRTVSATATDARKTRDAKELRTVFEGTAALVWETEPKPVSLAVGRQGTFTVRVRNNGGAAARNVRIEVELPPEVSLVQTTPNVRPAGPTVLFPAEVVEPGLDGEKVYTITYEARQSAQAWFKVKMAAEALGEKPLQTEKAVSITGENK